MKKCFGHKIGDTLVEVTLAIGIFSLVAVTVVSVISSSTSDAQANLETTVTREAIDTQAEALRFIQSAYVSNNNTSGSNNKFADIWGEVTGDNAADPSDDISQYNVTSCSEIYKDNYLAKRKAFILDVNQLYNAGNNVVRRASTNPGTFIETATYPRLYYSNAYNSDTLLEEANQALTAAEGIFIVPVKGGSTKIVTSKNGIESRTAYYDFYIRTCWYDPGSDTPSTISTVIRLYDPGVMPTTTIKPPDTDTDYIQKSTVKVDFKYNGMTIRDPQTCQANRNCTIIRSYSKENYTFDGWSRDTSCSTKIKTGQSAVFSENTTLYACLSQKTYTITFNSNYKTFDSGYKDNEIIIEKTNIPAGSKVTLGELFDRGPLGYGYDFGSWNTIKNGSGTNYLAGINIVVSQNLTLYAQWNTHEMQGFSLDLCKKYANDKDYLVTDIRDGKKYTVKYVKYEYNNKTYEECWMTSNLKIIRTKGSPNGILKASGSDFGSPSEINLNPGNGERHFYPDGKRAGNTLISSLNGGSYNFCAATAGSKTGCDPLTKYTRNSSGDNGDICPANWRIPSNAQRFKTAATGSKNTDRLSLGKGRFWTTQGTDKTSSEFASCCGSPLQFYMYTLLTKTDEGDFAFPPEVKPLPRDYHMYVRCVLKKHKEDGEYKTYT